MFKRFVDTVELAALACVAVTVVLLFTNESTSSDTGSVPVTASEPVGEHADEVAAIDGAAVYADRCAGCHGDDGQGGIGPQLADGAVVEAFPDVVDQIAVVTDGRGGMPGFDARLSAEEIAAVVEHTRTELGAAGG